jgi:protocatechuate 3,4-dioxygenase beta subunit
MTDTDPKSPSGFFDEQRSAEVVNARMSPDADPRLREVMAVMVRHLHAAVREAAVTRKEWETAIAFLTDTGHMCTDWRQEFILLSDVLGVSMLVDALNSRRSEEATPNTVLGPFHVAGAPHYAMGDNICLDGKGEPMTVQGQVRDEQGNPIANTTLDVWQANEEGFYDVQQRGIQPDFNLRGIFQTGPDGRYNFRSVKPRWYPIPNDGPVGKLLDSLGRHPNRAAHLHFIVTAPGYEPVVTHIFTPDCGYLHEDAVFGVKEQLVADFRQVDDEAAAKALGFTAPFWSVDWDFVMTPAKA